MSPDAGDSNNSSGEQIAQIRIENILRLSRTNISRTGPIVRSRHTSRVTISDPVAPEDVSKSLTSVSLGHHQPDTRLASTAISCIQRKKSDLSNASVSEFNISNTSSFKLSQAAGLHESRNERPQCTLGLLGKNERSFAKPLPTRQVPSGLRANPAVATSSLHTDNSIQASITSTISQKSRLRSRPAVSEYKRSLQTPVTSSPLSPPISYPAPGVKHQMARTVSESYANPRPGPALVGRSSGNIIVGPRALGYIPPPTSGCCGGSNKSQGKDSLFTPASMRDETVQLPNEGYDRYSGIAKHGTGGTEASITRQRDSTPIARPRFGPTVSQSKRIRANSFLAEPKNNQLEPILMPSFGSTRPKVISRSDRNALNAPGVRTSTSNAGPVYVDMSMGGIKSSTSMSMASGPDIGSAQQVFGPPRHNTVAASVGTVPMPPTIIPNMRPVRPNVACRGPGTPAVQVNIPPATSGSRPAMTPSMPSAPYSRSIPLNGSSEGLRSMSGIEKAATTDAGAIRPKTFLKGTRSMSGAPMVQNIDRAQGAGGFNPRFGGHSTTFGTGKVMPGIHHHGHRPHHSQPHHVDHHHDHAHFNSGHQSDSQPDPQPDHQPEPQPHYQPVEPDPRLDESPDNLTRNGVDQCRLTEPQQNGTIKSQKKAAWDFGSTDSEHDWDRDYQRNNEAASYEGFAYHDLTYNEIATDSNDASREIDYDGNDSNDEDQMSEDVGGDRMDYENDLSIADARHADGLGDEESDRVDEVEDHSYKRSISDHERQADDLDSCMDNGFAENVSEMSEADPSYEQDDQSLHRTEYNESDNQSKSTFEQDDRDGYGLEEEQTTLDAKELHEHDDPFRYVSDQAEEPAMVAVDENEYKQEYSYECASDETAYENNSRDQYSDINVQDQNYDDYDDYDVQNEAVDDNYQQEEEHMHHEKDIEPGEYIEEARAKESYDEYGENVQYDCHHDAEDGYNNVPQNEEDENYNDDDVQDNENDDGGQEEDSYNMEADEDNEMDYTDNEEDYNKIGYDDNEGDYNDNEVGYNDNEWDYNDNEVGCNDNEIEYNDNDADDYATYGDDGYAGVDNGGDMSIGGYIEDGGGENYRGEQSSSG